jgi:hypothetical protein
LETGKHGPTYSGCIPTNSRGIHQSVQDNAQPREMVVTINNCNRIQASLQWYMMSNTYQHVKKM